MLHEFLTTNRDDILTRSRSHIAERQVPTSTQSERENGLPLFLDQLIQVLRVDKPSRKAGHLMVAESAAQHGSELLRSGFTVGQVVQDYGSICQSVTELADERGLAITAEEFHIFNRCLDEAIAQAVTTYEHQRDQSGPSQGQGLVHLGFLAHELRNLLMTSMLTFDALARGSVGIQGSTGTLLGRSLRRMRSLIDRTLAEVRIEAGTQTHRRVLIAELIEEVEIVATLEANERSIRLSVDPGPYDLAVDADPQILASVVANLVQNAFKFTERNGHIGVRAHSIGERILIDVQDECGGLPTGLAETLFTPFLKHGADKTGMGLGLAISLKGVQASGGSLQVRDLPGIGCVFTVELPRAAAVA